MSIQQVQTDYAAQLAVRLLDSNGDPVYGVTAGQLTVTYKKQGDTGWSNKSVLGSEWTEVSDGRYLLLFSAAELDTDGKFVFRVAASGADTFTGDVDVVSDWATATSMLQSLLDSLSEKVAYEDLTSYKRLQDEAIQDVNAKFILQDGKIDRLIAQVTALLRKVDSL